MTGGRYPDASALRMTALHDPAGRRWYLTATERAAFLVAACAGPREVRTLWQTLHFTGSLSAE